MSDGLPPPIDYKQWYEDALKVLERTRLELARTRDDYRRLAESYNGLRARTETHSEPGQVVAMPPEEIALPGSPYPREWELEDSFLRERAEKAEADLEEARKELEAEKARNPLNARGNDVERFYKDEEEEEA